MNQQFFHGREEESSSEGTVELLRSDGAPMQLRNEQFQNPCLEEFKWDVAMELGVLPSTYGDIRW